MAKVGPKPYTKKEIIEGIMKGTGLSRKDVTAVLESLTDSIAVSLSKKGPGCFVLPGVLKIEKKKIPAKKARKHVPNPFKPGEFTDIAAKPARNSVKIKALKGLKEML
ncbi:MAG: HU family DNA-binding protein [Thermoguttaceae bacterium]|nr:HU family DNA-binding protein [Thermoguttaceae bacterium]